MNSKQNDMSLTQHVTGNRMKYMENTGFSITYSNSSEQNLTFLQEDKNETSDIIITVLKALVMVAIMTGAVLGNILVVFAVMKFERLRAITNYFIVSLACADLLVAICVMPFNASMEISGEWIFGRVMCDVFNSNDVLFSTASILHLCCISMDRYIAIMHPLQYECKMTKRRVLIMIAVTWISSVLISYIPIHSHWYTTEDTLTEMNEHPNACLFIVNKYYAVISSSISFWTPCTIMLFVYVKIYIEARKQENQIKQSGYYYNGHRPSDQTIVSTDPSERRNERKRMRREHKAAKTLGIIMGAFVLCFLPFFSWYLITTLCGDSCPYPDVVGPLLFWLGYFNSCLNPIIYAYFNRDFRHAFKKLLRLDKLQCANNSDSSYGMPDTRGHYKDHTLQVQCNYKWNSDSRTNV